MNLKFLEDIQLKATHEHLNIDLKFRLGAWVEFVGVFLHRN